MTVDSITERLLNPAVLLTMVGAGIAYGAWLWTIHIRPTARLWGVALFPGVTFLLVVWAIRAVQGVASAIWFGLLVDWLFYSVSGVLAVLTWRRIRRSGNQP
jgi:hypothetical protein